MNMAIQEQILNEIKKFKTIIIHRHKRRILTQLGPKWD